jgi:hypothetical protein
MSSKSSIEEILEIQEQEAIARAVAESLKDVPAEDEELARALAESLCDVPLSETEGLYLGPRSFPHSTKENNNGRSEKAPEDQTSKPVISDGKSYSGVVM